MNLAQQRAFGVVLNYLSIGVSAAAAFVYVPVMLHVLGVRGFGLYQTIGSFAAYMTILDAGLGVTLTRYYAWEKAKGASQKQLARLVGMVLKVYGMLDIAVVLLGAFFYSSVTLFFGASFSPEELESARIMLILVTINTAITIPGNAFNAVINAEERFVFSRLLSVVRGILQPLAIILTILVSPSAVSAVVALLVVNCLYILANALYAKLELGVKISMGRWNPALLKEMMKFSLYVLFSLIFDQIFWRTGQVIIASWLGSAAVATYSVATTIVNAYILFSSTIFVVFVPKLTQMVAKGSSRRKLSELFAQVGRVQALLVSLIVTAFIIFGRQFIALWAGPEHAIAYWVVLCFMFGMYVPLIQNLGAGILQAMNAQKFKTVIYLLLALVNVALSIPAVRYFGYLGCSLVSMLCLWVGTGPIINWYYSRRLGLDIRMFFRRVARPIIASWALCLVFFLLFSSIPTSENWGILTIEVLIYVAVFSASAWAWVLEAEEKRALARIFGRRKRLVDSAAIPGTAYSASSLDSEDPSQGEDA